MIERVTEFFYRYSVNGMAKIVADKEKYCVDIYYETTAWQRLTKGWDIINQK